MHLLRIHAIALGAMFLVGPAAAQVNIGIWGNGILGQAALRNAQEAAGQSADDDESETSARARPEEPAALSFTRSGDLSRQIEEGVAQRLSEMVSVQFQMKDPSSLVRTAGTRAIYRQELKKRGLPENSLSGATALFLAVGWELANGRPLSEAQTAAIFRQTAGGLQRSPLARKSGPELQQESEIRLIITALWLEEARVRSSTSRSTQDLADAVRSDLKAITRNDMRAYEVTENGFTGR
ncbi:MAG: hypothetical protein IBJ08_20335 [Pseudomonas sp.]|nr:hypothetical protein [Pseudomonas sp.]